MLQLSRLKKRLAVSTWALMLAALAAACGDAKTTTELVEAPGATTVASVRVLPESTTADVGESTRLSVEVFDRNGRVVQGEQVTWSTSDSTIASVDQTGTVQVLSLGSVDIRATARAISGSSRIWAFRIPVTAVRVSPATATVQVGQATQLTATVVGPFGITLNGRAVTWSSSSATVATVDASGNVTGRLAGTAVIRATSEGKIGEVSVTVVAAPVGPVAVASVTVNPASVSVTAGATSSFSATLRDSAGNVLTGRTVTWSSTNTAVASVSAAGLATGIATGTTSIRATSGGITGSASLTVSAATLQKVVLTPASVSLMGGAMQQFGVSGQWSNGATTAPAVTYSATGGTITAGGLYTAGGMAGTFRVIAVQQGGTLADTSAVTVTIAAPVLQAVVLSPASVSLASGATRQFSVSGQWSNGATTAPSVTYSATGGTSTAAGLYTAGTVAGTYRLVATNAASGLADTASITITSSTPPPPSPLANECGAPRAGWVWCDDFDADRLSSYFEVDNAGGNFARVNGVGNAGSYGMRARWSAGATNAGSLHLALGRTPQSYFRPVDAGTASYRELYWRVYVRNQAGWVGGGGDKLSRAFVFGSTSTWAQAMIAHVWSGDDNTSSENVLTLDPVRGTDEAGNLLTTGYNDFGNMTFLGLAKGTNAIFSAAKVGAWHCVEARARLNDAGSSNGATELWIDGVLDASKTGLNFLGSFSAYGLNAVYIENFWNAGSPAAQERYLDNLVVSTQRIGC